MFRQVCILLLVLIVSIGQAVAQPSDKEFVEAQYLAKAKANIEQYRKGGSSIRVLNGKGKPFKNVTVEINQISQDFLFGGLCEEVFRPGIDSIYAERFKTLFTDLFNFTILTFKWTPYEPEQGKVQWRKHEDVLEWCEQNDITVKGHTLGWTHHAGTPPWLYDLPAAMATDLYKARIYNIVSGYKSQINIWDVVNEPVTTIPWERALQDTVQGKGEIDAGVRYDVDGITLGETIPWIEKSYRWAQEGNPDGHYILNEFYLIAKPAIREKYFRLMQELKERNVPVKGVGIQAHEPRNMWFSPIEFYKTLDLFESLNLPIHITEFIPQSSGERITGWRDGTWTEEAQADFAEQFYILAFGHPSVASFNWWGFSDRYIWLRGGGLVDENNNPKPVYNRLKKLIKEDWMTKNVKLKTDRNGVTSFRGFFGRYQVEITKPDGSRQTFEMHLKENGNNQFEFQCQ